MPGLHRLPGAEPERDTVLEPGELITAVELPAAAAGRSAYRKVRERASFAFALVSVAALLDIAGDGTVRTCQLALGGVAHVPWRAYTAERALAGTPRRRFRVRARRPTRSWRRPGRCPATPTRWRWPATSSLADLGGTAQDGVGRSNRVEGRDKVTGQARYAYEYPADRRRRTRSPCRRRSPAARSGRSTRARPRRCPACSRC